MSHDWLMMTLERRHDLITVLKPYFLPKRLHSTKSYFIKAIDHTFYGFTGVVTHAECWENTRKACKSRAEGKGLGKFSTVMQTVDFVSGLHNCLNSPNPSRVYLSNRPQFLWVYRCDNPRGMLGEHKKSL